MNIEHLYDKATHTLTYVVWDESLNAVIIDPVLDYDPIGSKVSIDSLKKLVGFIASKKLNIHFILETHAHADHMSSSQFLRKHYGASMVIGANITLVQETFKEYFDLDPKFPTDESQFDRLVKQGDVLEAGALRIEVIETPGHTPACLTYKIGDAIFTGDALFMDDYGTGRCDFPRGSAKDLYHSVHEKLYALPDETRVFVGHDYQPNGRELRYQTTIGASKQNNPQLKAATTEAEFMAFRKERDQSLAAPKLLYQSVQVNIDAGRLPKPASNGRRYLRIPLNLIGMDAHLDS